MHVVGFPAGDPTVEGASEEEAVGLEAGQETGAIQVVVQEGRPKAGIGQMARPRPECFWPVDALTLAEPLVGGPSRQPIYLAPYEGFVPDGKTNYQQAYFMGANRARQLLAVVHRV